MMDITLSSKSISHERRVYALLDMFGDVGGFSDAIMMLFSTILGGYSPSLFFASVLQAVFRIDTDDYTVQNKKRKQRGREGNNPRPSSSPESKLKRSLKTSSQRQGV